MSSSKGLPYFPVWVDDSIRLTNMPGEHAAVTGARFNLWVAAACGELGPVGTLPDNDSILQPVARVTPEEWTLIKPQITKSWELRDSTWVIRRLVTEWDRRQKKSEKARRSSFASWGSRGGRSAGGSGSERTCDRIANADAIAGRSLVRSLCSPPVPSHSYSGEGLRESLPSSSPPPAAEEAFSASPQAGGTEIPGEAKTTGEVADSARLGEAPSRDPNPSEWLTPGQERELAAAAEVLRECYQDQWPSFGALVGRWRSLRTPWEPIRMALRSAIKNRPRDLAAYLVKILRIEEPNYHEREAIARHRQLTADRARERTRPRINAGMVSVMEVIAGAARLGESRA